jgi:hypothetical protein
MLNSFRVQVYPLNLDCCSTYSSSSTKQYLWGRLMLRAVLISFFYSTLQDDQFRMEEEVKLEMIRVEKDLRLAIAAQRAAEAERDEAMETLINVGEFARFAARFAARLWWLHWQ